MSERGVTLQVLRVEAGGQALGIEVQAILGIERPTRWARLPGAPDYVRGVVELRDQAVPVIDLAARLQLPGPPILPDRGVLLIESDEPVGLSVSSVVGVEELDPAAVVRLVGGAAAGVRGRAAATRGEEGAEGGALLLLDAEAMVDGRPLKALHRLLAEGEP